MVFGPDNGGRGVEGINQVGVANPFTFFNPLFSTGFGSNSSSTSALPNPPAANTTVNVGFVPELFGRQTTANPNTTSAVATQPPPFGSDQCGRDHQLFRTNLGTGAFQNPWPYGGDGFPHSGNHQFGSQISSGSSAATTSPFGNESPSYSSSLSTFGTISSGFRCSTTGPYTRSLFQENTRANNVSVFAPFTRSNLGISDIQGTTKCSYATTPEVDNFNNELVSISAMPFYQEKSHEELRLEDYQLKGRTCSQSSLGSSTATTSPFGTGLASYCSSSPTFGTIQSSLGSSAATTSPFGTGLPSYCSSSPTFGTISSGFRSSTTGPYTRSLFQENTSANNVSVFAPFTRSNLGISDIQGTTKCSYATTPEVDHFNDKLVSISAMPYYQEKSHEELRLEDHQLKGRTGSQSSLGSSAATTSPFGTGLPSYSSSSSTFGTISSGFRSSTTGSNFGISAILGSRICSYTPTPVVDSCYKSNMVSISAMPFYQEKSHEELRAEDYQLTGRTVFVPFIKRSGCEGTKSSYETSPVEGNIPVSNTTFSISTMPFNKEKGHEELRSSGDNQFTGKTCGYATGAESSSSFPAINVSISLSPSLISNSTSSSSSTGSIRPISQCHESVGQSFVVNPKLKCPEYFMEPSMDDLVANELKRPGFCCQVKDFVIGKRGYGSIKFLGETDVRNLDLESIVQFNIREVIFCMDKNAKLVNKGAEITLFNVLCIDKNTGKQYIDGPKVDKYKQLLMRKTVDQGAEFVSFDPAKGEWKFKVQHF